MTGRANLLVALLVYGLVLASSLHGAQAPVGPLAAGPSGAATAPSVSATEVIPGPLAIAPGQAATRRVQVPPRVAAHGAVHDPVFALPLGPGHQARAGGGEAGQRADTGGLWWKRLVYRRDTADGYELIVHLVRIPPFEKRDLTWLDEARPLEGVEITAVIGPGQLRDVQAMRPYCWDEPQQPVQRTAQARTADGRVEITVPEFRYHKMVVLRVGKGQ